MSTLPPFPFPTPTHAQITPRWIDRPSSLAEVVAALDAVPGESVSLDTEADSFHHYYEKVCLAQIAVEGRVFLVDPLAVDASPLFSRLASRRLLMHGADYDLRLLNRGYGFRAARLSDTMLAAQLLGEKEIGLAALTTRRLGVTLDKTHQRADWSARPLGAGLLDYAALDVIHLQPLADSLLADLAARGRLAWHEEECARLAASPLAPREADPENDWRLKGTNSLSDRERAFVRALWEAREERARESDRPPFRVLTNERLLHAARLAAQGEHELGRLFPGPRPLPSTLAQSLRAALDTARALPPSAWPPPRRGERNEADPALERAVEGLRKRRDHTAAALGLDPGVLASRAVLTSAARLLVKEGTLSADRLVSEAGMSRWRAQLIAS